MTKDTSDVVARLTEPVDWAHFVNDDHAADYQAERAEAAALISSLVAENERLIRDNIVAPAECSAEGCDDPDCPYSHTPLTLRQAYDNAERLLAEAEGGLAERRGPRLLPG
jgi:hypothetical protein